MAQAEPEAVSLLREVEGWDSELCRRQLSAALPRLLSMYQISDNWTEHIGVLRILAERFLPHINLSELEQAFFSKVLPKAVQLFDHLIYELFSQAKELTNENAELHMTSRSHLKTVVQLMEVLRGCVQHVCTMQETVPLEHIHSLPSSVLHVIKNTFIYCKDSESLYSDHLHLFADLLQSLFKETYALQKQLMELLDMISVDSCTAEDSTAIIVSVIHSVLEICSAISIIDHALHANSWKFLIRQSTKHKSLIQNSLKHAAILNGLCESILYAFQSCLLLAEQMKQSGTQANTDYKVFQRTIKLCRFFAVSLVHYIKEFTPFLVDSCSQLHQTYLQIYSKFPPSLHAAVISEACRDEIAKGFLVALDPLLPSLLAFRPFVEAVLSKTLVLSPELHFAQCRLLLSVMDMLPSQPQEVQALWDTGSHFPENSPRVPLFTALFLSLQQCSGELSLPVFLPGVMTTGQAESSVTLYHYVCIHLCAFVTSLSVSHFPLLEQSLLETILGSNMIIVLLAMDVWCFLARYGTADLCAHHAFTIASLIRACPTEHYRVSLLGILLRRLLFLMAPDHQVEFIQRFPHKEMENLVLWQHLSLKALVAPLRKQVAHELFAAGLAQCEEWLSSKRPLEELLGRNAALPALLSVCQTAGETLEVGQQMALVRIAGQLLAIANVTQIFSQLCLQQAFCLMFRLLEHCIQMVEPQMLIQVLTLQNSLVQLNPPDHVLLAVLDFVSAVGKLFIPPDCQVQVLSQVSCLFATLLASNTWLIHQHALEAFIQFAEETSHEDIIPQCLSSEETKSKVVCFLSKDCRAEEMAEARAERMKEENGLFHRLFVEARAKRQRTAVLQSSPKRTCYSPSERQYESAIDSAAGALEAVKLLLQKGPPPIWLAKKLEALQTTLNSLKDSTH
ncbi:FIGNL1-interacting regulator of recombination and mitosis [Heteronotia binoei]|uniref:FIGNL1-interacting regulator of recombination and mitosis n=1 Tax=Heteronotia binoei TaxID=13085 RepID=UPI0029303F0D|nr:FIGNL1-interacting regulator of recombination and mitosis [Heteronotia binoei]